MPLPPWGCWDTADREGRDASREARLDRGKSGRRRCPPAAGGPCPATPAAAVEGEGSGSCFACLLVFCLMQSQHDGGKKRVPPL